MDVNIVDSPSANGRSTASVSGPANKQGMAGNYKFKVNSGTTPGEKILQLYDVSAFDDQPQLEAIFPIDGQVYVLPHLQCDARKTNGSVGYDGHIDQADMDAFANCRSGPNIQYTSGCGWADLDNDNDVDQDDFGSMQRCYTGSEDYAVDPNCGN